MGGFAVIAFFLGAYLDIKNGQTESVVLGRILGAQGFVRIADIIALAVFAENTELTGGIVKLTDKLDTKLHDSGIRAVGGMQAVANTLAAGFLQGNDGRGGCNARIEVARAGMGIARGFAQLLNRSVQHFQIIGVQGRIFDLTQGGLLRVFDVDDGLGKI